jgi:Zn-dependent M16 (insulinase) family peptidase
MTIKNTNYEVIKEEKLHGIKSDGVQLRHKKSGARIILVSNEDKNKVFSIAFRTPAPDSTGVPHIMEHSVLCGSKNFPAKDPFVELVKGSLNTFLNAMTYPDKTVYPVASCNDKDFANLMNVYMDAVLYPNIYQHEEIFRQEGWSYELNEADSELKYNGVVYNEMKGAFSNPEGVLDRVIQNTLFPDTSYANESGGDPENIPDLTYEAFINFHKTYYHPANSYIYLYGDMDMEEKLAWLDTNYLVAFDKNDIDPRISEIELQAPFANVIEKEFAYSIAADEDESENTYLSYNKVIATSLDEKLYLAFQMLDYALLSAPGAPIKKRLTEAGIGQDISGSYDNGILQPIFSVVAKGAELADKVKFIQIIEAVLKENVANGIDEKSLRAGIHYYEFLYREADFGSYPKGLMYGLQMLDSWLYDETKPFVHIEALDTIDYLKGQVGTGYFENLIKEYILENSHGAIVTVVPEKGRTARLEQELSDKLAKYKANLNEIEIAELVSNTEKLREYQEAPESEENLACIPLLSREDISREIEPIINDKREITEEGKIVSKESTESTVSKESAVSEEKKVSENKKNTVVAGEAKQFNLEVVLHNVETNGIGYVDFIFDVSHIEEADIPYLGILQSVLGIIDTKNYEYGELFNEIHLATGGIGISLDMYRNVQEISDGNTKEYHPTVEVKMKALYSELSQGFSYALEILQNSKLSDTKRIKEILAMLVSKLSQRFVTAGHTTAVLRAMSYISPASKFKDATTGIEFYETIKEILDNFDEKKEELSEKLTQLVRKIFVKENLIVSASVEKQANEDVMKQVGAFAEKLRKENVWISIEGLEEKLKLQEEKSAKSAAIAKFFAGFCEEVNNDSTCGFKLMNFDDIVSKDVPKSNRNNKKNEGFKTASKVQYVAKTGNFIEKGFSYTGTLQILRVILSYDYLWQNIRVKGGAYGCMSGFNRVGEGYLVSYRDPHLRRTLETYEGIVPYLQAFDANEREMTKYIIGTMSGIDQPLTPQGAGDRSMNLLLNGVTEEMIRNERNQILDATVEDIGKLAKIVRVVLDEHNLCVIGSEEKIEEAKDEFDVVANF